MNAPIPEDYADLYYKLTHPDRHSIGTVFADVMVEAIKRIVALERECDQLRASSDAYWKQYKDTVEEVERLRAEVERLGRPVTDEEASDAVAAAMKMDFGGTYQEAMEALIGARRKP